MHAAGQVGRAAHHRQPVTPLDIALGCWLAACAGAGALHLWAPRRLAARTAWPPAAGWQREIALWNTALSLAIAWALVSRDDSGKVLLGGMIAVLSVLLAANHIAAPPRRAVPMHAVAVVANALGLILIVWGLIAR